MIKLRMIEADQAETVRHHDPDVVILFSGDSVGDARHIEKCVGRLLSIDEAAYIWSRVHNLRGNKAYVIDSKDGEHTPLSARITIQRLERGSIVTLDDALYCEMFQMGRADIQDRQAGFSESAKRMGGLWGLEAEGVSVVRLVGGSYQAPGGNR